MENNINIEELFKSNLQNMEAEPGVGAWEAIQSKLTLSNAASSGSATATVVKSAGFGLGKVAAIVSIAVGTGLGIGYLAFNNNSASTKKEIIEPNTNTTEGITENKVNVVTPEGIELTELSSVTKPDKIVSIIEVKKGEEKQKVLVEFYQPVQNHNDGSFMDRWISSKKDQYNKDLIDKLIQQLDSEETTVEQTNSTNNDVVVQKLDDKTVVAGIKASSYSGTAPLQIDFSNITDAVEYEWTFEDITTVKSKEASPVYTFNIPGNYLVKLQVKDANGNVYRDKILVEVMSKEEAVASSGNESSIKKNNVFTPNGDGINDVYRLEGKNIEEFEMTVRDNNGKLIFKTNDINKGWNGEYNGENAPDGTYVCFFTALGKDKVQHKDRIIITLRR